jgi:hypothetical protein
MRDGISVFGNYESTGWTRCSEHGTTLVDGGSGSVYFGSDVATETVLDGFSVVPLPITIEGARGAKLRDVLVSCSGSACAPSGVHTIGNVDGFELSHSNIELQVAGISTRAVSIENCAGNLILSGNSLHVESTLGPGALTSLSVDGTCNALIEQSDIESDGVDGVDNYGVVCSAPCSIRADTIKVGKGGAFDYHQGQTPPARGEVLALSCVGCEEVTDDTVSNAVPTNVSLCSPGIPCTLPTGYTVVGARIEQTPLVARNHIASGCGDDSTGLRMTGGRLENNFIFGGCFVDPSGVRLIPKSVALDASGVDIDSNYLSSPTPYVPPRGESLGLSGGGPHVRNNIIGGNHYAFDGTDISVLEHNDLLEPLSVAESELTPGGNFFGACWFSNDHLVAGSACIDAGTPVGAPADDIGGQLRDARPDVGPDEWSSADDPCTSVTCSGHGSCTGTYITTTGIDCACDPGYERTLADPLTCFADPCANNGGCDPHTTCNPSGSTRTCGACPGGYTGTGETGCVPVPTACSTAPCEHGCTCVESGADYTCQCPPGINGKNCDLTFTELHGTLTGMCGLRSDGQIRCWNDQDLAQDPPSGVFESFDTGGNQLCGIDASGGVHCFGADQNDVKSPPSSAFAAVSLSGAGACGLLLDGSIDCWGSIASWLPLPSGTFSDLSIGASNVCAVALDHLVQCRGTAVTDHGQSSPPPDTFMSVASDTYASCGLRTDGTLACWGEDGSGNPLVPPAGTFTTFDFGNYYGCGVRTDETLGCWGSPPFGIATTPPPGSFRAVATDGYLPCAIATDDTIACWGPFAGSATIPTNEL